MKGVPTFCLRNAWKQSSQWDSFVDWTNSQFFQALWRLLQLSSQTCSLTQALEAHQVIFMPAHNMCSSYANLLERDSLDHLDQRKLKGIRTYYL